MKLSRAPSPLRRAVGSAVSLPGFGRARPRRSDGPRRRMARPRSVELAHHRIDQERHVVVDDFDHRDDFGCRRCAAARSGFSARRACGPRGTPTRRSASPQAPAAVVARQGLPEPRGRTESATKSSRDVALARARATSAAASISADRRGAPRRRRARLRDSLGLSCIAVYQPWDVDAPLGGL